MKAYRAWYLQWLIKRIQRYMICRQPKPGEDMLVAEISIPKAGLDGRNKALGLVDMRDDAPRLFGSASGRVPDSQGTFPRPPIPSYRLIQDSRCRK